MTDSFELEVVSHLPQFTGKVLKPWFLDGIDTVGVWGQEPFELRFRNKTGQKVQVKLSMDGTDVLTGKKAHTNTDNEGMWVVDAWGTMTLKAWPETNQKGRGFVFGDTGDSVAAHTHGDLSSKGIIAAAVFTEAYKPSYPSYSRFKGGGYGGGITRGGGITLGGFGSDAIPGIYGEINTNKSLSSNSGIGEYHHAPSPAVGAGEEMLQKIGKAQGLITPKLDRIVRVRYLWWDDVEVKLAQHGFTKTSDGHPTGFPGDREERLANLGTTPTMGSTKRPPVQIQRFV